MTEPSEQIRLTTLYAGMSDGELEKIASESHELTETARKAVRAEMQKRGLGLTVPVGERDSVEDIEAEPGETDLRRLTMVRRFRDLHEAMLAKGSLDSAGIECYLGDENIIRMDWFISNLIGGVKLMVRLKDLAEATEILNQPIPEGIDYGLEATFEQPTCPHCESLNISFEELNKPLSYGSAWIGVPIRFSSPKWKCSDCHAAWTDNEDESLTDTAPQEKPQP
jgi:transposase-like protein